MTIKTEILTDSVNTAGDRLTTMRLRYPRFIHAEVMTHRVFSRNARSSRAVPVERMIEEVLTDPAMPVRWGSNKPGMQDGGEWDAPVGGSEPADAWWRAAEEAARRARMFHEAGYHKQVVNRLLEPFLHIDVIVSATEWENFFALRCHPDADPTMRALACAMRAEMNWSAPRELGDGEWHLPMGDDGTLSQSVARCARVSYGRSEGRSRGDDTDLYTRLRTSGHWSPFEHQARANPGVNCRNFRGWWQLRAVLDQ